MANLGSFNANKVDPMADFEPIPAGKYLAVITGSEMKATKSGNGSFLELVFEVAEGEFKGRKLWARLNLRKAEISYREAQNALNRAKEMSSQDLISKEEYETTQLASESAKTGLEEARLAYEYTRVIAPIAGTITERFIELGDMITQSKILFQLAETRK